jgi:pilus assembly protein CpaC
VGGEFPIPIAQGVGGGSAISIEYKEFGVRLTFRPEVLGDDRIRLQVAPEVSELSEDGSVTLSGVTIPSIKTRRSQTTVELASGQTFAMAGLLQSKDEATVARVPILGDIPVLGPLFRSVRYKERQTELLVLVTAEFVAPLSDGDSRPMPGDLHVAPSDWQLFMEGKLKGTIPGQSPRERLAAVGLVDLKGPGAWKRSNDKRRVASDPLPTTQVAARGDTE